MCNVQFYLDELEASGLLWEARGWGEGRLQWEVLAILSAFWTLGSVCVNLSPRQYINNFYPRADSATAWDPREKDAGFDVLLSL